MDDATQTPPQLLEELLALRQRVAALEAREAKPQRNEESHQYIARLRVLHDMNRAILAAQSLEDLAQIALTHLRRLIPCWRASVSLFNLEDNLFSLLAVSVDGQTTMKPGIQAPLDLTSSVHQMRDLVRIVDDTTTIEHPSPLVRQLQEEGLRSYINIPLVVQEHVIGSLNLGARIPRFFTAEHIDVAQEVASVLALALQQATLRETAQRQADALRTLNETLEQRIAERTAELAESRRFIEQIRNTTVKLNGYASEEEMLPAGNDIATEWYVDPQRRAEFARLVEEHGHVTNFESEVYRHKARERIWISETARLVRDHAGTPLYYEGAVQDITARKRTEAALRESEQRYRGLVESQRDLIVRVDSEGLFTFVNDAYCRKFAKRREELLGTSFVLLVHEDDKAATLEAMQKLAFPPYRIAVEQRALTAEGWRWFAWEDYAIRDEQGRIVEIQAVGRDITERKQAEEGLQESNRQLEKALVQVKAAQQHIVRQERLAAVGQLAAGIAHDFNNILTGILGFAELLQLGERPSPLAQEGLQTITEQGRRAAHLIRQILDFSRQSLSQPQPLELPSLLKETVNLLERLLPEHIDVRFDCDPGDHWIEADVAQLQQALTNLAVNARDAMPDGGTLQFRLTHLTIGVERPAVLPHDAPAGQWVVIEVSDTGTGMTSEVQEHLFEPFFSTKEVGAGTGLGLSQVYGIVRQQGGYIGVRSCLGQGSTFSLYFPLRSAFEQREEEKDIVWGGHGETVLLVEDEAQVLKVLQAMLEHLGYQVLTARNGHEALTIYETQAQRVRLVITDMIMPEMGGEELYRRLLQYHAPVNVIALSGYPFEDEGRTLLDSGKVRWLQKPMELPTLALAVHEALQSGGERQLVDAPGF